MTAETPCGGMIAETASIPGAEEACATPAHPRRKGQTAGKGSRLMPQHTSKVLADEEMARRLHEELNGPEVSPAAAATRRNRKAPTFYTPPLPGSLQGQAAEGTGPSDDEGGLASERQLPSFSEEEKARAEKAGSSAGKRAGRKAQAMDDDSAEGSPGPSRHRGQKRHRNEAEQPDALVSKSTTASRPQAGKGSVVEQSDSKAGGHRAYKPGQGLQLMDSASDFVIEPMRRSTDRSRPAETSGRVPITRSSVTEDAGQADSKKPTLRATRSAGDAKSEDLHTPKTAASGGLASDSGTGFFAASSSQNSGEDDAIAEGDGGVINKQRYPKIPKLPMCRKGQIWYRARKVSETKTKVLVEFPGIVNAAAAWLPKDSPRIWTGSYKGKDWKHLGDGAWEPKVKEKGGPRAGPGRGRKRKNAELAATQTTSDEEEISDEDEEGDAKPVAAPAESRPASSSARQKPQARKDDEPVAPAAAAEALQGADAEAAEPAAGESGARRGRRPSGKRARVPGAEQDAAGPAAAEQADMGVTMAARQKGKPVDSPRSGSGDQAAAEPEVSELSEEAEEGAAQQSVKVAEPGSFGWDVPTVSEDAVACTISELKASLRRQAKRADALQRFPSHLSPNGKAGKAGAGAASSAASDKQQESRQAVEQMEAPDLDRAAPAGKPQKAAAAQPGDNAARPRADGSSAASTKLAAKQAESQPGGKQEGKAGEEKSQPGNLSLKVPGSGLGALAQALAHASASKMGQQASKPEVPLPAVPKSARNRKRAAAKQAKAALESGAASPSGHSNAPTENGKSNEESPSSAHGKSSENDKKGSLAAGRDTSDIWKGAWKLKHKQKLEEVEAEEEAAESQDISEDAQEPVPESLQPVSRPMRAIRAPRYAAMDRADVLPTRSSRDTETGSPPTPLRRAGRGRGRWANHVKRGNGRGLRPMPTPSPQDTPHAAKAGGRGRRGGGRWGSRPQPKPEQAEDICISAFGGLVNALDNKAAGLPFAGFPSLLQGGVGQDGMPLCHRILEVSPEHFVRAGLMGCAEVKEFRMPPPPVPLFKIAA